MQDDQRQREEQHMKLSWFTSQSQARVAQWKNLSTEWKIGDSRVAKCETYFFLNATNSESGLSKTQNLVKDIVGLNNDVLSTTPTFSANDRSEE